MPPSNMPEPTDSIASSPWVNQTDQDFGGPSSTLGSNHLQSSIDKLTKAVNDLKKVMGPGGKGRGAGNGGFSSGTNGPATNSNGGYGAGFGGMVKQAFGKVTGGSPAVVGGGFAVAASFGSYGKGQLPGQIQMSSFVQRQSLMGAPVGQAGGNAIRFGTYGGHGQNLNAGALGTADATMGGSILGAASGSWNPSSTNFGRAVTSAANLYGYANPGQGYAASAQMAAQQYNPQTSMAMMQAGMAPALNRGGGQKSSAQIFQNWSQRQFGKNAVDSKSLAWAMRSGATGDVNFQSIYGQQAPQFEAAYAATNALMFGRVGKGKYAAPGMSAAAADKLMNQAERGTSAQMNKAQATLSRYGVNQSDQQKIQNLGATQTGRSSDVANSFNAGLSAATNGLTRFNDVLTRIINLPGVNQAVGASGGFAGGISTLTNTGNMAQAGGGIAGIAKGFLGGAKEDVGLAVAGRFGGRMGMAAALAAGAKPVWVVGSSTGLGGSSSSASMSGALKALGGGGGVTAGEGAAGAGALGASAGAVAAAALTAAVMIGIDVSLITHKTTAADRHASKVTKNTLNTMPTASRPAAGRYLSAAANAYPGGASGGVVSGQDMGADSQLIAVRGQEGILVPGATRAMGGPAGIDAINRRYGGGGKNLRGHYAQGGVTGNTVASYAASQSGPGNKNLYTWGGGSLGAWDCSGFAAYVYEKYGFFPEKPGSRHGTSESQYSDSLLKAAPDQPGALVFFDTHDGQAAPSHVGVSLGGGKYAGADGPQGAPNAIGSSSGAMGFRIPKKGFSSSAGAVAAASSKGTGTKSGDHGGSSGGGAAGGSSSGLSEAANVAAALGGSAGGATSSGSTSSASKTASSPAGGSPGPGGAYTSATGSLPGNAKMIGQYLMAHGFSKIQASGVIGNIMAEDSNGSPETTEAGGGGGQGLIQWTGHGNMITGNYANDMATQLKALLTFGGGASSMKGAKSPAEAASMYLMNVEKPADPAATINLRETSANAAYKAGYAGGTSGAAPGWALVGEQGVEAVRMRGGEQVLSHSATLASGKLGGRGYAGGTGGTITFGDINIHYGGSPSDPGAATHNAQETVRAIKTALAREDMVDAIASGRTH